MNRLFGTDGVRGVANADLTPELAYKLARAGAVCLTKQHRPRVLIGRDTRLSGSMLEAAMVAGFCSVGADVVSLGVVTTPGVAYLTRQTGADAGVMISASHNPFPDNGIKFFSRDGFKLPDDVEDRIAALVERPAELPSPTGAGVGRLSDGQSYAEDYLRYLVGTGARARGLRVVVDCANGAGYYLAPRLLAELGAEVTVIADQPDGTNINAGCGSTHLGALQAKVAEVGADLGLALDGDADRCLAVDEGGREVDGDQIMGIIARRRKEEGRLAQETVVATVMSNLGLERYLNETGIRLVRTKVGDRYVLAEMLENGYSFGGEQSGHIVFGELATTGDGLLTAVQLIKVLVESGHPLSKLAAPIQRVPQVLVNARIARRFPWEQNPAIGAAVQHVREQMGDSGRILVRPSGTEPVIRVMIEGLAPEEELIRMANSVVGVIERESGRAD
ncbi:MAG: phosphoglucosamine mutase [Bacillota bacterium]